MAESKDPRSSTGLLNGISVVECGEGVAASYATKLMADLGADVIKIEPPEGDWTRRYGPFPDNKVDPEKSGLFIYLNANKRGVTLDLSTQKDRHAMRSLLAKTDLLVHNVAPALRDNLGLTSAKLGADFPQLVITAISPFGDSGPYRDWNAYELNVVNAGGWSFLSPGASEFPSFHRSRPSGIKVITRVRCMPVSPRSVPIFIASIPAKARSSRSRSRNASRACSK